MCYSLELKIQRALEVANGQVLSCTVSGLAVGALSWTQTPKWAKPEVNLRACAFTTWPSNLLFVVRCVSYISNLRKIGQKLRSLSRTICHAIHCIGQTINEDDDGEIQAAAVHDWQNAVLMTSPAERREVMWCQAVHAFVTVIPCFCIGWSVSSIGRFVSLVSFYWNAKTVRWVGRLRTRVWHAYSDCVQRV